MRGGQRHHHGESPLTFTLYILISGRLVARLGSAHYTAYAVTSACVAPGVPFGATHPVVPPASTCRRRSTVWYCSWPYSPR